MNSKVCATLALLALLGPAEAEESKYEQNMKDFARRLPAPLDVQETVFDWWPLDHEPTYTYEVVGGRWTQNRDAKGTIFTLDIQQDKKAEDVFHFKCKGFDDFPYEGLKVRENRVYLLVKTRHSSTSRETGKAVDIREKPFVVFPLFEGLVFYDALTEYDFLKQFILRSTGTMIYAPVLSGLFYVDRELGPGVYAVSQAIHAPGDYTFKKGIGPIEWGILGGYYLKLVSHSVNNADKPEQKAKDRQDSLKE